MLNGREGEKRTNKVGEQSPTAITRVPDDQDDFPNDPDEYLDTDGDGEGNNCRYG